MTLEGKTAESQPPRRASLYKRIFAAMMANSNTEFNRMVGDRKRALLGTLRGTILEIGPGAGPNLAYYPRDIHWIGVEPNPAMYPYIQKEAQRLGLTIELRDATTEVLPVADASVDAVVSTLVLCSVHHPAEALKEILRVLKPGGQFVFIEHVAAPRDTSTRRIQNLMRPAWAVFGDGCQINRETWTTIEQAGFSRVQIEHFKLDVPIVGPHIAGTAVK